MGWLDGSVFIYLFLHWISGKGDLGSWTPRPAGKGGGGGKRGGRIVKMDGVTAQGMVCRLELGGGVGEWGGVFLGGTAYVPRGQAPLGITCPYYLTLPYLTTTSFF